MSVDMLTSTVNMIHRGFRQEMEDLSDVNRVKPRGMRVDL